CQGVCRGSFGNQTPQLSGALPTVTSMDSLLVDVRSAFSSFLVPKLCLGTHSLEALLRVSLLSGGDGLLSGKVGRSGASGPGVPKQSLGTRPGARDTAEIRRRNLVPRR